MLRSRFRILFFALLGLLIFPEFSRHGASAASFKAGSQIKTSAVAGGTLLQSTFMGGSDRETGYAIAVQPVTGDVYIAGYTTSTDLPGRGGGADATFGGHSEAFVARFSSDLQTLYQSTYIGGSGDEEGTGIAVDSATGDVYVTGYTSSADFPGITNGADPSLAGYNEVFVARLSSDLRNLYQSTFLGGASYDAGYGIAIDPTTGDVLVTGVTNSGDFPNVTGGADPAITGDEAFVSRLSSDLRTIYQSTYLGGSGYDSGTAIAIHPTTEEIYVTGTTGSNDFPNIAGGADTTFSGDEAFVSRLSSDLRTIYQSTFLGGSADDSGFSLTIDPSQGIYVTGQTFSNDFLGIAGGADTTFENSEAFVARLSSDLQTLRQSTYLGGGEDEVGYGVAVHPVTGYVYVIGYTGSSGFPNVTNLYTINGTKDIGHARDGVASQSDNEILRFAQNDRERKTRNSILSATGVDTTFGGSEAFVSRLSSNL